MAIDSVAEILKNSTINRSFTNPPLDAFTITSISWDLTNINEPKLLLYNNQYVGPDWYWPENVYFQAFFVDGAIKDLSGNVTLETGITLFTSALNSDFNMLNLSDEFVIKVGEE